MAKRQTRRYNQADEWKEFSTSYLKRFPKADLHVHLDGSIRVNTLWQLAKVQGVKLGASSPQALKKKVVVDAKVKNLADYLKSFDITLRVLQTFDALARVAFELAEDAAKENVRYMEVRYSPLLHLANGLTIQDTVDAVLTGLHKAESKYRIKTGIILCGMRHLSAKRSLELADAAVAYMGEGVVAFDLAGQEKDYPAKRHREAFYRVLNANQNVTVHAGEAFGPASIHQALHYCGAHRIGHGTRLLEDASLLDYVRDHRIPLEICLTSNVQTRVVDRLQDHPFRQYLDNNLRVTLNTDSRLVSNTNVTRELYRACRTFRLNHYELRHILLNGFRSAFLPYREKVTLIRDSLREIDAILGEKFPMDDLVVLQDWRSLEHH